MSSRDVLAQLSNLVDVVDAIGRFWVLVAYEEIKVSSQGGGGERLVTERTGAILSNGGFGVTGGVGVCCARIVVMTFGGASTACHFEALSSAYD